MKEIVADTNVLVSALLTSRGLPREILTKASRGEIRLVLSPAILLEIVSVFSRPELRSLIPESRISHLVSLLHESARIVKTNEAIHACRDSKDNRILECAAAGKVDGIVTGDKDLLVLNPFRGIPILNPRDFLASL